MNRRKLFGFLAGGIGSLMVVPATMWGEGIPAILDVWKRRGGFFKHKRPMTEAERNEFARLYIDSRKSLDDSPALRSWVDARMRIDYARLERVRVFLAT